MEERIDKNLLARRFSRAINTYDREAVAQKLIALRTADMIVRHVEPPCESILEIGCGTGFLTRCLTERLHPQRLTLNDLCEDMQSCFADLTADHRAVFMGGDAEQLGFPGGQHLIVSCSTLQWLTHPETFLVKCHDLLVPEGHIAFSTFGPNNMKEVATVSGSGLAYRTLHEWTDMLTPHYDIVATAEEHIEMTFDSPLHVLRHLKETGVTAVGSRTWTRRNLHTFSDRYTCMFARKGRVPLTYHPLYIIVRKRA